MIYLASPYSHANPSVREQRYQAACGATASLLRAGQVVFSPIVHFHPLVAFGPAELLQVTRPVLSGRQVPKDVSSQVESLAPSSRPNAWSSQSSPRTGIYGWLERRSTMEIIGLLSLAVIAWMVNERFKR